MQIYIGKAKRCSDCNRIISVSADRCPYCSGASFALVAKSSPVAERKPMTKETRKKLLIGASSVLGLAALVFLIVFIVDSNKINRSINEPLDMEYAYKQEEKMPGFSDMCAELNTARTFAEFPEGVTYKALYEYLNEYYDNESYISGLADEADVRHDREFRMPYVGNVKSELVKWQRYVEEHDIDRYLKVSVYTGYEEASSYYGYEYHPKWYYKLSMPNGYIKNCEVMVVCDYNNNRKYLSLSELQKLNGDTYTYFPGVDDYEFWDRYDVSATVLSVTLNNDTKIRKGDEGNVPADYANYFSSPSLRNEELIIINNFNSGYKSKSDYITEKVKENLESLNPECYSAASMCFPISIDTFKYYGRYNSLIDR